MLPAALDAVPTGTDVLMLVHPQNLPEKTLYAIDQFVLRGGKAIVFVDPYSELAARSEPTGQPRPAATSLGCSRHGGCGCCRTPSPPTGAMPDGSACRRPAAAREAMDYVAWLNLRGGELNRDDVITASLNQVTMASAGILEPLPGASTKLEPLITTSPASMKLPADKVAGLPDVAGLLTGFKPDDTRYMLAARVTGPAETAFPDGRAGPERHEPGPAALGQSAQPINVVVVADTDILDDRFWARSEDFFGRQVVTPVANNADFVANAIEVLGGGEDLVGLRSRGTSVRPFEVVEQIQRAAEDRYAAEQQALERKLKQTQAKLRELVGRRTGRRQARRWRPSRPAPSTGSAPRRRRPAASCAACRRHCGRTSSGLKIILEFVDIALVPIIVAAAALVLGALRLRRWRHRPPAAA